MSTFTENYNLIKPQEEDYYDVQDFNENMDTIDAQMMQTEREIGGLGAKMDALTEKMDALHTKLGTTTDSGTDTLFGLLKQHVAVKAVQRVDVTLDSSTKKISMPLTGIDPSRCMVYFQLLTPPEDYKHTLNYALRTNALDITFFTPYASVEYQYIFWIIEFY